MAKLSSLPALPCIVAHTRPGCCARRSTQRVPTRSLVLSRLVAIRPAGFAGIFLQKCSWNNDEFLYEFDHVQELIIVIVTKLIIIKIEYLIIRHVSKYFQNPSFGVFPSSLFVGGGPFQMMCFWYCEMMHNG